MEDKIAQALGTDTDDHWISPTTQVFAFVGLLYFSLQILSFWRMIVSLLILPGTPLTKFGGSSSWAVITGASDGIGKEYALQLAAKGFNIALVSRTQSKLLDLAKEIKEKYNVDTRNLAIDFALNRDKDYTALKKLIDELNDISILINNVGLSHSIPVSFTETPEQEMRDIITVNCTSTLRVTQMIAPGMQKRRRGLILTMASFGGIMPTPLLATYSGSKAFLQQWSSALSSELQPYGVVVQLVQSYLVTSAMSKIRRSSMLVPTPKQFVNAALNKINRSGGAQDIVGTSTPYWAHGVMHWAIRTFVGTMNPLVVGINGRMHEDIRRRALKKREREAGKTLQYKSNDSAMAAPAFGFSAGDFVAAIKLLNEVSKAFQERSGASTQYQQTALELEALQSRSLQTLQPTTQNADIVDRLRFCGLACQITLSN